MQLDSPFIRLPLRFDPQRLAQEILAIDEDRWCPHPQGYPGNSALHLVTAGGTTGNDATRGAMLPTEHLAHCPYVRQVMASFGCTIGRSRLMRLDGNAEATAHVDVNYYWMRRMRIHVPVVTQPEVTFHCGDARVHMAAGECWVFDTWRTHNVVNPLPTRRIHLVCDVVGSAALLDLVDAGFRPDALHPAPDATARFVAFDPAHDAQPPTERHNVPAVMHPWEMHRWTEFAIAELARAGAPDERVAPFARLVRALGRDWFDLWARWGDTPDGWPHYRDRLEAFAAALRPFDGTLVLRNGTSATESLRHHVVRSAFVPELAPARAVPASLPSPPSVAPAAPRAREPQPTAQPTMQTAARFDRPVFVVCPPRSGSSLLFETLALSPGVHTIGGESHRVMEQIPQLSPAARRWESNRVDADAATPMTVAELTHGFVNLLRDRDGRRPGADATGLRLLEKTPKNSLRVPFLAAAYPDARFVFLFREPRDTVSSMIDAWRSGRFVTYPKLPDWGTPPWSLVLTPGWREWKGRTVPEIAARQWGATVDALLDSLEALAPERWCVADYAALLADPAAEIGRLCAWAGLPFDRPLDASALPDSRHTLTKPDPDKWKRNAAELDAVLPLVEAQAARMRAFRARHRGALEAIEPVVAIAARQAAVPDVSAPAAAAEPPAPPAKTQPFNSVFTGAMPELLKNAGSALAVTTYQSGRLILLRVDRGQVNTHFKAFPSPMGLAVNRDRLAIATLRQVWDYRNAPGIAGRMAPEGAHDACWVPRASHYTGDIRIHEIGFAQKQLWVVATRFSCLATLDPDHNFVPRWRPRFVTALDPTDRCHLNGMCIVDDRVRFVTALAETDTPGGWREHKGKGGLLIDVASGEFVARGLSMPHSPRWYDGRMWVLESGKGALSTIDLATGKVETVVEMPGFTRGLAFAGHHAFVGLSQVRESVFGGLPLTERLTERVCGVWVVDLRAGRIAGFLRFEGNVQEIFDLQFLPARFPELLEPEDERSATAFVLPDSAVREVPRAAAG